MSSTPKQISSVRDLRQFIKDNLEPVDDKIYELLSIDGRLRMSAAISVKRQADAMERIAEMLERFENTPRN